MEIRERIVVRSFDLLIQQGLKSVTMNDVAANLGMSKRTIYENFSNKKELVEACVEYMIRTQEQEDREISAISETLYHKLFYAFDRIDATFQRKQKFSIEVKKFFPDIFERQYLLRYNAAKREFIASMERGIEEGVIQPQTNLELAVFVVMETVYNIISRPEIVMVRNISVAEAFKYVIIHFFRGISTWKGIELIDQLIKDRKTPYV
ncbi:MAG: TetR/AcrR family transcriptional regulator [Rikenellaceae bacterium]|jgi:AcrR family transcriptional regulator|nr:TetR/AcrR family transcriptional regulator [Rikenellaceae bacterium]